MLNIKPDLELFALGESDRRTLGGKSAAPRPARGSHRSPYERCPAPAGPRIQQNGGPSGPMLQDGPSGPMLQEGPSGPMLY